MLKNSLVLFGLVLHVCRHVLVNAQPAEQPGINKRGDVVISPSVPQHRCDRAVSRRVRQKIELSVLKYMKEHEFWPEGCPMKNDIWDVHEKKKIRKRGAHNAPYVNWECGYDGKKFKSENYIDLHMERFHMNETSEALPCLADYCDVFDVCDKKDAAYSSSTKTCDSEKLDNSRHLCEGMIESCFPLHRSDDDVLKLKNALGNVAEKYSKQIENERKYHVELQRKYCSIMYCDIRKHLADENEATFYNWFVHSTLFQFLIVTILFFVLFAIIVVCLDSSDEIVAFFSRHELISAATARDYIRNKERVNVAAGNDRTKQI